MTRDKKINMFISELNSIESELNNKLTMFGNGKFPMEHHAVLGKKAFLDNIIQKFQKCFNTNYHNFTLEHILKVGCEYFLIQPQDILNKHGDKYICNCRQVIIFMMMQYCNSNSVKIGKFLNNYDHSSILYSKKVVSQRLYKDEGLRNQINNFLERLENKK